jgi:hypothetical protein
VRRLTSGCPVRTAMGMPAIRWQLIF